ncbi:hypothetical protein KP509_29G053600 [Ceratopteris richardii]|uniref:Uncharacterized protein n=1 Tax=Ceratopteris richardii TaxID=49495 RepID=A0A8T2R743_CERRI|nr:hypothetical protein KP509_29G053600 [Ceratopteris richardii]
MPETEKQVDNTKALLIGTLAPGVNAPTWAAWKVVMLGLAISLGALLWVALRSTSSALLIHVLLLICFAVALFALLTWFVGETGFVTVDQQMKDLNLAEDENKASKAE